MPLTQRKTGAAAAAARRRRRRDHRRPDGGNTDNNNNGGGGAGAAAVMYGILPSGSTSSQSNEYEYDTDDGSYDDSYDDEHEGVDDMEAAVLLTTSRSESPLGGAGLGIYDGSPSSSLHNQQHQRRRKRHQSNINLATSSTSSSNNNIAFRRRRTRQQMYKMMPRVCFQYFEVMMVGVLVVVGMTISLFVVMGWCIENGYLSSSFLLKLNSPPGRNYWQWKKYWTRPKPNQLSQNDLQILRYHQFPAHVGVGVGGGVDENNEYDGEEYNPEEFEILDHPGTFFLSNLEARRQGRRNSDSNSDHSDPLQKYLSNMTWATETLGISDPDEIRQRLVKNLTVPRFWDPPIFREYFRKTKQKLYNNEVSGVRKFLGDNGKYLLAPEEAVAIGSYHVYDNENNNNNNNNNNNGAEDGTRMELETILVMISSYRDPECHPTVEDLFERAAFPERIRVAIVDQRVDDVDGNNGVLKCGIPPEDKPCVTHPDQISCIFQDQIDRIQYNAMSMVGPTFARHLTYRLYRGEYFVLQVDSHVRFVAGWDEDIIEQWKSVDNEMAVISTYMNDISKSLDPVTHKSLQPMRAMMCKAQFEWPGEMEHIKFDLQQIKKPSETDTTPRLHPFWAAGFSFGRGHFVVQVPYDPWLPFVFQGEEILQTIRGFTYGYDYYAPIRNVAFHIYQMKDNAEKRSSVHKFNENELLFPGVKKEAYKRLIAISGTSYNSPKHFDRDEQNYGLGKARSLKQFFTTFGIDPRRKTIEDGLCKFVHGTGVFKSMHETFKTFLRFDNMGIDYDRVWYRHRAPDESETYVDPKELERLREQLRRAHNSTDAPDEDVSEEPNTDER